MSTHRYTFYVTTPIYYVNDKPHIGHAYTTLVADVLARYHRETGADVFFSAGTDEHGNKIAEAASKAGKEPKAFADEVSELFRIAWKSLNVSHDDFIRTTDARHKISVDGFMQKLYDGGFIYQGEYEGLYCTSCERFYTEKELTPDGLCPDHKRKPELIKEKNYFFNLKKFIPGIIQDIESGKIVIYPAKRKNEVLANLNMDLEDFSVSREKVTWGIPLPFDTTQRIYVWVEALQNYISVLGYNADESKEGKNFKKFWPADVQVIGKDISKFHCIFWPALLKAAGLPVPKSFIITGFFTVDGQKMSKTIGNVLDPQGLVEQFGADATRYLLLSQFAVGEDGDVKAERFVEQYNADLANTLGNLVSRVATMIEKYQNGVIEGVPEKVTVYDQYDDEMKAGKLYHVLMKLMDHARAMNKDVEDTKPWQLAKTDPEKLAVKLSQWKEQIFFLGEMIAPFMPEAGKKITDAFKNKQITNPGILFPKR